MIKEFLIFFILFSSFFINACNFTKSQKNNNILNSEISGKYDTATFAAGCFWCVEAIFSELKGVKYVQSGYTGGITENPSYEDICTGETGHAEAIRIIFDKNVISYIDLLEIFWQTHDPTTLNRQGADIGTQYRSAVFYNNETQKNDAENFKKKLNENMIFDKPIVTEIIKAGKFYIAEYYHQNYYANNSSKPYCTIVIKPKLDKLRKKFKEKIK